MHARFPRSHAALIIAGAVAFGAGACSGGGRSSAAGDAADGLHPDSFVAPARTASPAGARLADTAVRRAAPDRRGTTTQGTGVVIAGSPSGFALTDDAVQPRGGVTSGQVASVQEPTAPTRGEKVDGGSAPPAPATQEPEPPTIIVNQPVAPAPTPTPTSPSPSTPPGTTPSATLPGVIARPAPHSPKGAVVRDPRPGTSDTASARPCGAAGTSDTASRSPCGQPGTSDTASARRPAPVLTRGTRGRPIIPLTPQRGTSARPPQQVREARAFRHSYVVSRQQ